MNLPLPQQSYMAASRPLSSQRLVNFFVEESKDALASVKYCLYGTPGLKHYYSLPGFGEPLLCLATLHDYLIVADTHSVMVMKAVDSGGIFVKQVTWESLGYVAPATKITTASSGDEVVLLNHEAGRLLVVSGSGDLPTGWDMHEPSGTKGKDIFFTSIACIASVYAASCKADGLTYVKYGDVLDPESFQYAFQIDSGLDYLTGVKQNARELWCFTPNTIEVITPTGSVGSDYFAKVAGAAINRGTTHYHSICVFDDNFLFVGSDDVIYMSNAYTLKAISTPALLTMIKRWGKATDIVGSVFSRGGHDFYLLKYKGTGHTIMYDLTTGSWSERESGIGEDWEGELIVRQPNGQTYITSSRTGKLYTFDDDTYTDNGMRIRREFVFPTLSDENKKRVFYYNLMLDMDAGLGPGDTVMLDWSDDGGYTWEKEVVASLGERGEYSKKIQFRRLGSAIQRIYRVRLSTSSPCNVLMATIETQVGQ